MIRALAFALLAAPAVAQDMPVPSGLAVSFVEVILEPEPRFARFRFLAPDLGQPGWQTEDIAGDFGWLCEVVALPALEQAGWDAAQVIISIADRPLAFGESVPDAVQYFEGFAVTDGTCVWEPF